MQAYAPTLDTLSVLHLTMERAARSRVEIDIRDGYPVSRELVDHRAEAALSLVLRTSPSAKGTAERHAKSLRATFRGEYERHVRAIVDGEIRL